MQAEPLADADIGIAIGAGSYVAVEAGADTVECRRQGVRIQGRLYPRVLPARRGGETRDSPEGVGVTPSRAVSGDSPRIKFALYQRHQKEARS